MTTRIEIDGVDVQIYESSYDYASRNANFSNYVDEDIDASAFEEKDEESKLPKVLVRFLLLYEDLNFSIGKQVFDGVEFPETIEIGGVEYTLVNFSENKISYLRRDAIDEPVYTLIYRTVQINDGVYLYVYPVNTEIFETEEAAQAKADELNNTLGDVTIVPISAKKAS
jgi:hypothetical protein